MTTRANGHTNGAAAWSDSSLEATKRPSDDANALLQAYRRLSKESQCAFLAAMLAALWQRSLRESSAALAALLELFAFYDATKCGR